MQISTCRAKHGPTYLDILQRPFINRFETLNAVQEIDNEREIDANATQRVFNITLKEVIWAQRARGTVTLGPSAISGTFRMQNLKLN